MYPQRNKSATAHLNIVPGCKAKKITQQKPKKENGKGNSHTAILTRISSCGNKLEDLRPPKDLFAFKTVDGMADRVWGGEKVSVASLAQDLETKARNIDSHFS